MAPSARRGFDRLAPYYDRLAQLVFGKSIQTIQAWLVQYIPPGASVLIVGGGTGEILEVIASLNPNAKVYFVDISEEMIARARKRDIGKLHVAFHCGEVSDIPAGMTFDCVCTPFFLDLFEGPELTTIFAQISNHLKPTGKWLYADFQVASGWMKPISHLLIWSMYRFFRSVTGIGAARLEDVEGLFSGFECVEERVVFGGMVVGRAFGQS